MAGRTMCVYSPKGGVGKTILSMNLAGIAGKNGKKVLLVDYDMFNGGISLLVNENITKTVFHLTDDLSNNRFNNFKDYIYKYNENIDLLCAPKDPRQGAKINSKYLNILLQRTTSLYDLIIIDTSCVLDEINLSTLDIVDNILFVVTNDIIHVKNLRNIINIFKDNGLTNFRVLYNASLENKIPYFSVFDIKKIIGANIDYSLSRNFFIKEIDSFLYNNIIPVTEKKIMKKYKSDISNMKNIIDDVLGGEKANEKK